MNKWLNMNIYAWLEIIESMIEHKYVSIFITNELILECEHPWIGISTTLHVWLVWIGWTTIQRIER